MSVCFVSIILEKCLKERTKTPSNLVSTGISFKRWDVKERRCLGSPQEEDTCRPAGNCLAGEGPSMAGLWYEGGGGGGLRQDSSVGRVMAYRNKPFRRTAFVNLWKKDTAVFNIQWCSESFLEEQSWGWWERLHFRNIMVKEDVWDRAWIGIPTEIWLSDCM